MSSYKKLCQKLTGKHFSQIGLEDYVLHLCTFSMLNCHIHVLFNSAKLTFIKDCSCKAFIYSQLDKFEDLIINALSLKFTKIITSRFPCVIYVHMHSIERNPVSGITISEFKLAHTYFCKNILYSSVQLQLQLFYLPRCLSSNLTVIFFVYKCQFKSE